MDIYWEQTKYHPVCDEYEIVTAYYTQPNGKFQICTMLCCTGDDAANFKSSFADSHKIKSGGAWKPCADAEWNVSDYGNCWLDQEDIVLL